MSCKNWCSTELSYGPLRTGPGCSTLPWKLCCSFHTGSLQLCGASLPQFLQQIQYPKPIPPESIFCHFVAFLGQEGLKHRTLKVCLSGLRLAQIHQSFGNPFLKDCMPLLNYVLTDIKQAESRVATHTDPRLPITIQVLRSLKLVWLSPPSHPDSIMLWAASCVGFFGFPQVL